MQFIVSEDSFAKLPNACFGVVVARGIDNGSANPIVAARFEEAFVNAETRFKDAKVKAAPEIQPYREAFRTLGINPNKFLCSIEALFTRIAKGKGLPAINPIVDLGNAVSLKYVVPIGAHDITQETDDMMIRLATEDDVFTPFGSTEIEKPDVGEAVYAVGRIVRTRRWTWRQSEVGKITPQTKDIFVPIDGFTGLNESAVLAARDELAALLTTAFGVKPIVGFVDAKHPMMSLD